MTLEENESTKASQTQDIETELRQVKIAPTEQELNRNRSK